MVYEVFVDTSGFYSLLCNKDDEHRRATRILKQAARRTSGFVTSDYVLDETATLLKARGYTHLVPGFFDSVFDSHACRVEWMDPSRFQAVATFFLQRPDHQWSFTDCSSFVLMKELRLRRALTKDSHFSEAGFVPLLT